MGGLGEIAAIGAATCWASSSIIHGRVHLTAWSINFAKNLFGFCFTLIHLIVLWLIFGGSFMVLSTQTWAVLALSGVIGIVLGDTCYFRSLQILGPRRSLVVATSTPIFSIYFGWQILGEQISLLSTVGIVIALIGIAGVIGDKQSRKEAPGLYPGSEMKGVVFGLLAAICQAAGFAIGKVGMHDIHADTLDPMKATPLEATCVRLLVAVIIGFVLMQLTGRWKKVRDGVFNRSNLKMLVPAAGIGTWLGIWASQIAAQKTEVAIASMLMSTSPLIAIPLVWYFNRHSVSWYSVLCTVIAIIGISIAL